MIAHIDADAFFASVLQRKEPRLKGKPLLALGMGGSCVIAASYEAKAMGVQTGMRLAIARKLAPDSIALPSDFAATGQASRELFAALEHFAPQAVERASPDEGFLSIHAKCNLFVFAHELQEYIHRFLDLPVSIGIASSKTLAKMGSKARKPKGICIIRKHEISTFLAEHHISAIPGIGQRLTPRVEAKGWHTAADLARAPREEVTQCLGKRGTELHDELHGISVYSIITQPDPPKSISRCRSFKPTNNAAFLYGQLITHLQRCSTKLRRAKRECAQLGVWLRIGYAQRIYTERKIGRYVSEESLLLPLVRESYEQARAQCKSGIRFTQAGLVLFDVRAQGPRQSSFLEEHDPLRVAALQSAIDHVRGRFGHESVRYGPSTPPPSSIQSKDHSHAVYSSCG